ncbi:MAG TPA: hypothetical protein VFS87_04595 [Qipengyuania sp.]|nr:hypothetical protein [Qipengyuania sp.]
MPDTDSKPESQKAIQSGLAPENHNDEQHDEDAQAQTLADEARGRNPGDYGSPTDSVKAKDKDPEGDSTQDLVDHMRDMERSGRIDMGAYRGEDNMDDNEDKYGEENKIDDLRSDGT